MTAAEDKTVKAIGAGHSFTPAAMTNGVLVRLDQMPTDMRIDKASGRVTVGAGMTLHALSRALDKHRRALPNLGDIDVQTIAGATQTGTHGTGLSHPNIATGITGFELVTGTGDVIWCTSEHNAEAFACGRVGLGALGIVTRVELETVPAFNLHGAETVEVVADILGDWNGFIASAEHAEFFWMPGTRRAIVKRNRPTTEQPKRFSAEKALAEKLLVENLAFGLSMKVVRRFPAQRKRLAKLMANLASDSDRIGKSYEVFASPRHVKFVEMEYGIDVDAVPEALERVQEVVATLPEPPSFPVEVRVSAADDIPLSTGFGRTSGWIAVHRYIGTDYEPYFRAVESIMNDYGGRPHWGKMHFQSAATLSPRYPEWERFMAARAELDPQGTFANPYLDRVLGTKRSTG